MGGQSRSVIRVIVQKIDDGLLGPGDGVDEKALVQELGVSHTPIREAILKLEAQGLVQRMPRKGAAVFKPSLKEFLSILEVDAKLEGQAAGLAARRLSEKGRAQLEAATAACESHVARHAERRPSDYHQLNLAFHGAIADGSGNPVLAEMIRANARRLMGYYRAEYRLKGVMEASALAHRSIAEAILEGDETEAEARMSGHVQMDQARVLDLLAMFDS